MNDNIIMLEDENGNTVEFEAIDVFEFNRKTYFALLEVLPEEEETDEVLLMRVEGTTERTWSLSTLKMKQSLKQCSMSF